MIGIGIGLSLGSGYALSASLPLAVLVPSPGATLTIGFATTISGTVGAGATVALYRDAAHTSKIADAIMVGTTWSYDWTPVAGDAAVAGIYASATLGAATASASIACTVMRGAPEVFFPGGLLLKSWNAWRNTTVVSGLVSGLGESVTLDAAETAVQANPAIQPARLSADPMFGGWPSIRGTGFDEHLLAAGNPALNVAQPYTAIIIGRWDVLNLSAESAVDGALASPRCLVYHDASPTMRAFCGATYVIGACDALVHCMYVYAAGAAGTVERYYQTGARVGRDPANIGARPMQGVSLLSNYDGTWPARFRFADVLIVSGAISAEAKATFESGYLGPMGFS